MGLISLIPTQLFWKIDEIPQKLKIFKRVKVNTDLGNFYVLTSLSNSIAVKPPTTPNQNVKGNFWYTQF